MYMIVEAVLIVLYEIYHTLHNKMPWALSGSPSLPKRCVQKAFCVPDACVEKEPHRNMLHIPLPDHYIALY